VAIINLASGAITYLNVGSATRNATTISATSDGSSVYVFTHYALDSDTTKKLYRLNATTFAQEANFGTVTDSSFDEGGSHLLLSDGTILLGHDLTTTHRLNRWDDSATSSYYEAAKSGTALKMVFLSGTTCARIGGTGGNAVGLFGLTDGVQSASFNITTGCLALSSNSSNGIVVGGAESIDEDTDTGNLRAFNTDLSGKRFATIGTGQIEDILTVASESGVVDVNTYPAESTAGDNRAIRKLVAFGTDSADKGECWYEDSEGSMVELSGSNDGFDPTVLLTAAEAYQKVFVANDSKLRVADFTNTYIQTDNISVAEANAPNKGNILTGAGGATLIVDYITSVTGGSLIYGKKLNATAFADGELVTGTNDANNAISFNIKAGTTQTAPPHWYTWTVYGGSETYGSLPNRAALVCNYRGRLVLSGNPEYPHQWYMSRQANPWDWLYAVNDAQAPVAGANADAGEIGDVIVALAPNKDDYLIMGCVNSMWVMRGDPAAGGSLDEISLATGIFGPFAYCWDASDNFYFFGSHGVSRIPASLAGVENLSITTLPNLISDLNIDPTTHRCTMGYDREREGITIIFTVMATGAHTAYWYDLRTQGFFPESYGFNPAPFSSFFYEASNPDNRKLLIGGSDGYIRYFDDAAKNDDAGLVGDVAISSHAVIGPAQIGQDASQRGRMKTMSITTGTDTDGVTYDIHVADSAEEVVDDSLSGATPLHTGTISSGNRVQQLRPRSRGAWMGIKLENTTASETWQFEKLVADIKPAGDIK
jgi:hypothetical protein